MRRVIALLLLAGASLTASACSDDSYIATNEGLGGTGATSAGGSAATGGEAATGGSSASGGEAGMGGEAGLAGSAGVAGAAGAAGGGGSCTPGQKQDVGTCQKCGTSRRTCGANGTWGSPVCEDQKECNPGDKTTSGCTDPCAEKTCGSSCTFGACGKKSGVACLYKSGSEWQCCGAQKWQYCNKDTCDWHPCAACPSNSSCYTSCK